MSLESKAKTLRELVLSRNDLLQQQIGSEKFWGSKWVPHEDYQVLEAKLKEVEAKIDYIKIILEDVHYTDKEVLVRRLRETLKMTNCEKCAYLPCNKEATKILTINDHLHYYFCEEHYKKFEKKLLRKKRKEGMLK